MRVLLALMMLVSVFAPCSFAEVDPSLLTLPIFRVYANPSALDSIIEECYEDIEVAGRMEYQDVSYEGVLSLRGATARNFPKRSWEFSFRNSGPNGVQSLNFNADYLDATLCRNYLSMKLAEHIGLPSPGIRHVSLFINDNYMGVFTEVENVDDCFFRNHDLTSLGFRIKGINHGGRLMPLLDQQDFDEVYRIKQASPDDLDTFSVRTEFLQWATEGQCAINLPRIFDVNNVLDYFAFIHAIANGDGYTKNFYMYESVDRKYHFVPWDADASLGFNWQGVWVPGKVTSLMPPMLSQNPLFNRLIESEIYLDLFNERLRTIASEAFPWLEEQLDSELDRIANDVFFDTAREKEMADFWAEGDSIHVFLQKRREFLSSACIDRKITIDNFETTHDYLSNNQASNTFSVHTEQTTNSVILWIGDQTTEQYFVMYDDGVSSGDAIADDQWYTATVSLEEFSFPCYYCFLTGESSDCRYPYPASGFFNYNSILPQLPTLRDTSNMPVPGDIDFGPVWRDVGLSSFLLALINRSNHPVDLNACCLMGRERFQQYTFQGEELLLPGDTLFVGNKPELEASRAPWRTIHGKFFGWSEPGACLYLTTSSAKVLASYTFSYNNEDEYIGSVVVNEFNYHGQSGSDPGDWIEIYLRSPGLSITGWTIRDSRIDHEYVLPENANSMLLHNDGYLVITEDIDAFKHCFPTVKSVIGDLGFGLGNSGDEIAIHDSDGRLVDLVRYSDSAPWPGRADGQGPTLELMNPDYPNAGSKNWTIPLNCCPLGTPGKLNSRLKPVPNETIYPEQWQLTGVYPNPFNSQLCVTIEVPEANTVTLVLYNILGQAVDTFTQTFPVAGSHRLIWQMDEIHSSTLSSGMYFLQMVSPGESAALPVLLLK